MERQSFYESFDEECTTISGASITSSKLKPKLITLEEPNLSRIVPLYGRETNKDEIKLNLKKKFRQSKLPILPSRLKIAASTHKIDNDNDKINIIPKRTVSKGSVFSTDSLNSLNSLIDSKPKKTYLEMFHAKIGYVVGNANKEGGDTERAVYGGNDTFRTAVSSNTEEDNFTDAASFVSDSSSFYLNHIEEEKRELNKILDEREKQFDFITDADSLTHLKSVSEYSVASSNSHKNNEKKKKGKNRQSKITKYNNTVLEMPTMGGLGPDRESTKEKLQKLKRQQSYGQKVSNQNRIKMLEMQVVKNFKIELKKSADLTKCTENVLKT